LPIEDNVLNYGGISGLRHLYADLNNKPGYLKRLLLLSAQAMNLKHPPSADEDDWTPGRVRNQSIGPQWQKVWDNVEKWWNEIPDSLQPVFQRPSAGSQEPFSTMIFADGASTLAMQLYHTTILLLLQARPRTTKLVQRGSTVISPLWHALKICSIAYSNDCGNTWDPIMIPSLKLAAGWMTHHEQQTHVLQVFARVQNMLGWKTQSLVDELSQLWGVARS